ESELRTILAFIKAQGITNVVWLATDVHHGRLIRYQPTGDLAGLVFHEFISGPVSALSLPVVALAKTFGPVDLFAKGGVPGASSFFNFGVVKIAEDGTLTVEIRDVEGKVPTDDRGRPGTLTLPPRR